MAEQSPVKKMILENVGMKRDGQKSVSYSQYTIFRECPHRWSLTYKYKLFPFTSSASSVFGTAIHETVQHWLSILYNQTIKASDGVDFGEYLFDRMAETYKKEVAANNGNQFIPKQELKEYYADGINILNYLRSKKDKLFAKRDWEMIAVELPLYTPIMEGCDVLFNGFIDLLFYNKKTKEFWMPDIKTSTRGWSEYQRKDEHKLDQIRLYKHYLAKHYNLDVDKIDGQYFILKRKVYEDAEFPIPRHTFITPAQGTAKVKLAVLGLESFVKECFNPDGTYRDMEYKKCPGSACKFCPFNTNKELCNQRAD